MGPEADPITESGSEPEPPTVEDLVLQLQSSFFPLEFQYVAQTLKNREQRLKETHLEFIKKIEEGKNVILSENIKLKAELKKVNGEYERKFRVLNYDFKKQRKEIDELKKVNGEYEGKVRVLNDEVKKQMSDIDVMNCDLKRKQNVIDEYEMKVMGLKDEVKTKQGEIEAVRKANGEFEGKLMVLNDEVKKKQNEIEVMRKRIVEYEKMAKDSIGGKERKDCDESYRPPLFSEKKDSMQKTEPKSHEIIQIDDDDDDDLEFIPTNKRSRLSDDSKRELKYSSASRFLNTCQNKCNPFFSNLEVKKKG